MVGWFVGWTQGGLALTTDLAQKPPVSFENGRPFEKLGIGNVPFVRSFVFERGVVNEAFGYMERRSSSI